MKIECPQCHTVKIGLDETCEVCGYKNSPVLPLSRKTIANPIIIFSVVTALVVCFSGYKFYLHMEKVNADRQFSVLVVSVAEDIIRMAASSEMIINEIKKEWGAAIDSHKDFNVAIRTAMVNKRQEFFALEDLSKKIGSTIKTANPPERKEADYQQLKKIYLLVDKYANMALAPSGSLLSYSTSTNQQLLDVRGAIKELEMME